MTPTAHDRAASDLARARKQHQDDWHSGRFGPYSLTLIVNNDLIDLVSLRVFGQLVAYSGPVDVSSVERLERRGPIIRFQSADPIGRAALIRVADALTSDVAIVTAISWYTEETGAMVNSYEAEVHLAAGALIWTDPHLSIARYEICTSG